MRYGGWNIPTDELAAAIRRGGRVDEVSLVAEFAGARFGGDVGPAAFQFEVPEGAKRVQSFIPPHPGQLMGEKVPSFRFFDLNQNPVTSESLAGQDRRVELLGHLVRAEPARTCPNCKRSSSSSAATTRSSS